MSPAERLANHGADPVLERRRRIGRLAAWARWAGYGLYAMSVAVFLTGLATGLHHPLLVDLSAVGLVAGSVLLAPAIIAGYAVRAANRADAEGTW